MYGIERLKKDLKELGFTVEEMAGGDNQPYAVILGYVIELGRFAGKVVDLGIMGVANYPQGVPSAIHVRANPQLLEKTDTVPNVRNITDSPLGVDWLYWSKNFNWTEERTTRRLISQINTIFKDA